MSLEFFIDIIYIYAFLVLTRTIIYYRTAQCHSGPGSSVGIATGYGLDRSRIESRFGRDFPHLSRPALGPIQPPVQWVPGLSGGKERPGCDPDPSPTSSAVGQTPGNYPKESIVTLLCANKSLTKTDRCAGALL